MVSKLEEKYKFDMLVRNNLDLKKLKKTTKKI